jgi:hypothetical protein
VFGHVYLFRIKKCNKETKRKKKMKTEKEIKRKTKTKTNKNKTRKMEGKIHTTPCFWGVGVH